MIKHSGKKIIIVLVGVIFTLAPAVPALAFAPSVQPLMSRPIFSLKNHGNSLSSGAALTQSASENWSGYAATGINGTFTSVSSSWVQPTLNCASNSTSYSASWVGLDGYNDQTVEQIGTEANCINGQAQYYTWYEMYPQNPYEILTKLSVAPGNIVSATVTYNPSIPSSHNHAHRNTNTGSFTLALNDTTTGVTFSTIQTSYQTINRSSAEVITEAPWSNGILPLTNFGIINFNSSEANGSPLGSAPNLQAITMDNPYGMIAVPSVFDNTNEIFSITWSDPS